MASLAMKAARHPHRHQYDPLRRPFRHCIRRHLFATTPLHTRYDILIVGGGAIGSSIAYHIASKDPRVRICVVERDPTYQHSSTTLSAGGIRQQFSLLENIQMSMYGAHFLKNTSELLRVNDEDPADTSVRGAKGAAAATGAAAAASVPAAVDGGGGGGESGEDGSGVHFQENGYLFLASRRGESTLRVNHRLQREAGADWIELLDAEALKRRFPFVDLKQQSPVDGDNGGDGGGRGGGGGGGGGGSSSCHNDNGCVYGSGSDEVVLGSYGTRNEGWFDPWLLLQGLRRKARSLGVEFVHGEVGAVRMEGKRVDAADVRVNGTMQVLRTDHFVNAAGAFSNHLLSLCGPPTHFAHVPVRPRKRLVFSFHCRSPSVPPTTPLVIDTSGVYFRPEGRGGRFICGVSPPDEEDPDCQSVSDLEDIDHSLFERVIWPALYNRVPAFEELKVLGAWAGFYEYNTLDQNGIMGLHPDIHNLFIATGFSGHGLQHSPAVGRAIAELYLSGRFETLDLSRLGMDRVVRGEPLYEANIV